MTALTVTARLDTPSVGLLKAPVMLDGPLAWAAATLDPAAPPLTREHAPDIALPLERWHIDGHWGWCVSAGHLEIDAHLAVQLRRRPATAQMSRYTTDRRHHSGLGPHKARDTVLAAAWISTVTWSLLCTDRPRLEELLGHVTHLGAQRDIGYGRVAEWTVGDSTDSQGWRHRPLPATGGVPQGIRPPYYHPSRRVPCSSLS